MEKNGLGASTGIVAIGGSAGSLEVILQLLPALRKDLPFPIVIVLHRKNTQDSTLTDLLAAKTSLAVKEADEKDELNPGTIYIAPPDYHLLVESDKTISLDASEKVNFSRPSIDVTFETIAESYGAAACCILLSGASADGAEGLLKVKNAGGTVIVQNPATAEVAFMPNSAISLMRVNHILAVHGMIDLINRMS